MSESEQPETDPVRNWNHHVCQAAKSFLKCAVAIDDRPFGDSNNYGATGGGIQSKDVDANGGRQEAEAAGPVPKSPKTAIAKRAVPQPAETKTDDVAATDTELNAGTHKLNLRLLADSFAQEGIICGTLIPDSSDVDEQSLIERAKKMAQTADILIIDWFLKSHDCEITLKIVKSVLEADKDEGGRTRLICIYTGEDQLESIRELVEDRFKQEHSFEPSRSADDIKLTDGSTSIVFIKKVSSRNKLDCRYTASEKELPKRLIDEFASLIDGLLPSFAASSIGAIRRNTHGILNIFRAELDAAYVGNRAISDPSEAVAELVRELLVSELDNQIGFAGSADRFLSKEAISLWIGTPHRVRSGCVLKLKEQRNGQSPSVQKKRTIDAKLIRLAACGDIESFDKTFGIGGTKFNKISEKQRLEFTRALCESEDSANKIEEEFARLAANKREAFGRETIEQDWRPSLTLGTLLVTFEPPGRQFYMCITRACDMMRLSRQKKEVILLHLEIADNRFNLVIPDSKTTNVKLRVPTEFSDMKIVEFKVEKSTRRITATPLACKEGKYFRFETTSGGIEYRYLGELRYLRALRDVSEIVRNSTAIGIADSEWLRLNGRN